MFDMNKFNKEFEMNTNDLMMNILNNTEIKLNQLSNDTDRCTKEIVENNKLEAIISMPRGVFQPYAGVSTAVMIFTKTTTG